MKKIPKLCLLGRASLISCALIMASCASFRIEKVPNRFDREQSGGTWTAEDQKWNEQVEGLRFYMSRAFVAVHKPFPIDSETYIVPGRVSPDGRFVALALSAPNDDDAEAMNTWKHLRRHVLGGNDDPKLPTAVIKIDSDGIADTQGGAGTAAAKAKPKKAAKPAGNDGPQTKPSGNFNFTVATDLAAQPTIPMRDFFDVTYLPDYSEQYVIHGDANFGNLSIKMTMGPGNTLMALDANVDNSAITGPLLDAYSKIVKSAGTVVADSIAGAQGGAGRVETQMQTDMAGLDVSIAIHIIRFAAPGLYPVLKPSEYAAAHANAQAGGDGQVLVGRPPATVVSYNVYELMVAELVGTGGPRAIDVVNGALDRAPRGREATSPATGSGAGGGGGQKPPKKPTSSTPKTIAEIMAATNAQLEKSGAGFTIIETPEINTVEGDRVLEARLHATKNPRPDDDEAAPILRGTWNANAPKDAGMTADVVKFRWDND